MFTGISLDQALRYWKDGKEVIVLDRTVKSPSGGYETYSFDELFRNLELLADVPAVENPEFKQAVEEMVRGGSKQKQDKPSGEESITPPSERPEVSDMPLAEIPTPKLVTALVPDRKARWDNSETFSLIVDTDVYDPDYMGKWEYYKKNVIAWRPLPEPYHPERSEK